MPLTLETQSQVWEILKDHFLDTVTDTFYGSTELLSMIERNKKGVKGRQIILKYKIHGNQGIRNVAERGTLPTAGSREYAEGTVGLRYFYAVVDLSGQEIHSITSEGAFIDLIADAFEDTNENSRLDVNRQLWGDGSGIIGSVATGGVSGDVLTLNRGHGLHFFKGMECEFRSSAGVARTGTYTYAKVLSVNFDDIEAMEVTFDQMPIDVVATDYIYRNGSYVAAANLEFMGFKGHFSTSNPPLGTYQGANRATAGNEYLQALVSANGGTNRAFTGLILQKAFRQSKLVSGMYPDTLFTSDGVKNAYVAYLEGQNQPTEQIVSQSGHAAELKFIYGGKAMNMTVLDDAPVNSIYLFNKEKFEWRESAQLQWEQGNGGKMTVAETTDRQWGRMFMYGNLINIQPNSMHLVDDIIVDGLT